MNNRAQCGNSVQGIYTYKVCEAPALRDMRREAYAKAGFVGEYDGSMAACVALPDFERLLHDAELSKIVEANDELLNSEETKRGLDEIIVSGPHNNLILDQGLNFLFTTYHLAQASAYCAVGTGTTTTFTDSGATTATTAGLSTTVTASASFFTAGMVGQLIKFDSGEERYIVSQTGTACVVNSAVNIAAPTLFTVWAVNQVGLATETKRTNTYLIGTGNCGTTSVGNIRTFRRTYDFTAEVANQNYTELGWSQSATVGSNLFSRTLVSGGTVSVLIGQQLRVIYDIVLTVGPNVSTAATWSITGSTGWPVAPATNTDGDYIRNGFSLGTVDTSGNSSPPSSLDPNQPSVSLVLATGSTLPGFGGVFSAGTTASGTNSASSYTDGNFYRDFTVTFGPAQANATNWRGVFEDANGSWVFVFDQAQTKAGTNTLSLTIRISYSRTLVNP
jgi:hypothetical protein